MLTYQWFLISLYVYPPPHPYTQLLWGGEALASKGLSKFSNLSCLHPTPTSSTPELIPPLVILLFMKLQQSDHWLVKCNTHPSPIKTCVRNTFLLTLPGATYIRPRCIRHQGYWRSRNISTPKNLLTPFNLTAGLNWILFGNRIIL